MAAEPKKKISKVRGRTRRAHNRAELKDLVKSAKYPGLSVPHRFRKYFDSLASDDKELVRATGADRKTLVSQTTKPKATAKPKTTKKAADAKPKADTKAKKTTAKKSEDTKKTDSDK